MFRRLALALALALVILWAWPPSPALGHAVMVQADPTPYSTLRLPPRRVTIWANEAITASYSSLQVFDSSRRRVDATNSRVDPDNPRRMEVDLLPVGEGQYTVLWTVNSRTDGHTVRGTYLFAVSPSGGGAALEGLSSQADTGTATGAVGVWSSAQIVQTAARWLVLASALLLVGGLLFRLLVPRLLKGQARTMWHSVMTERGAKRWARMELLLLLLLPVSTIGSAAAVGANAAGSWAQVLTTSFMWGFLVSTPFGMATIAKTLLALALMAAVLFRGKQKSITVLGGGLAFLGLVAFSGHAAAVEHPFFLPIVSDWVHLVAASAWLGGMTFAAITLVPAGGSKRRPAAQWQQLVQVLSGYSPIAVASVALLIATGLYNSATRLSGPGDLVSTGFGLVLAVKLAAVAGMVALSYLNAFVARPQLQAALEARPGSHTSLGLRLRRLLRGEPLIGVIVVAATAMLAAYPPPGLSGNPPADLEASRASPPARQSALTGPPRFSLAQRAEDLLVITRVGPGGLGPGRLEVLLSQAADGSPVPGPVLVRARASFLYQEAGSQFITTQQQPDGSYAGVADFFFEGRWRLELIVRREDTPDVTANFDLYMPALDATHLLDRAEKAMNSLQSMRLHEELSDGAGLTIVSDTEFQAPDRLHLMRQDGSEVYVAGSTRLSTEAGGRGQETQAPDAPFVWPSFNFKEGWVQPVIVRAARLEGQPHSIVAVFDASAKLHYLLWIGTDDNLVRRWQRFGPGHFVDSSLGGFNSTAFIPPRAGRPYFPSVEREP